MRAPTRLSPRRLDLVGKDSVNLDHLISPEERLHFAMGTQ
jgi:hypothetical protein